jgi:hypothetical protein
MARTVYSYNTSMYVLRGNGADGPTSGEVAWGVT